MEVMCNSDISVMTISPLTGEMKKDSNRETPDVVYMCEHKCDLTLYRSYEVHVGKGLEMIHNDWI